jgi:hypothetical protein
MKVAKLLLGFSILEIFTCGCSRSNSSEESLLENVFNALKDEDWEAFQKLTITYADFLLREQKINVFMEKQSYAGGVLKPEEMNKQRKQFEQTIRDKKNQINFKNTSFSSLGSLINETSLELFSDENIFTKTYSLRIQINDQIIDSKNLFPTFTIVRWYEEYRLLNLNFPKELATNGQ